MISTLKFTAYFLFLKVGRWFSHHETNDPEKIFNASVRKGHSPVGMAAWIGFESRGPDGFHWSLSRPRPWNFNFPRI